MQGKLLERQQMGKIKRQELEAAFLFEVLKFL